MIPSLDRKGLRRGRRIAARTPMCRPCLFWLKEVPARRYHGVAMDVNPYGMRIRAIEALSRRATILVQMMRDDDFEEPPAEPVEARIARCEPEAEGFFDHGIRIERGGTRRVAPRPLAEPVKRPARAPGARMYTFDVTVGDRRRRGGR